MLKCKEQRRFVENINILYQHMLLIYDQVYIIPCGLVARISGSHPGGPGSIPGKGDVFCCLQLQVMIITNTAVQR